MSKELVNQLHNAIDYSGYLSNHQECEWLGIGAPVCWRGYSENRLCIRSKTLSIWTELGFTDNPYSPKPISGNEVGESILVGRDSELTRLVQYISSSDTHPTLEGANGVGKTSLVAVAGYKLHQSWMRGESGQAIIPLRAPFQLTADINAGEFKKQVLYQVAQAFINHHEPLKRLKRDFEHLQSTTMLLLLSMELGLAICIMWVTEIFVTL